MAKKRHSKKSKWEKRSLLVRNQTDHCVVCFRLGGGLKVGGVGNGLHVHHLAYRKGGRGSDLEKPEDMVVLCVDCHNELHRSGLTGRDGFLRFRAGRRAVAGGSVPTLDSLEAELEPSWVFD